MEEVWVVLLQAQCRRFYSNDIVSIVNINYTNYINYYSIYKVYTIMIVVITRKIPKLYVGTSRLTKFSNQLTKIACAQKGYINSDSYWNSTIHANELYTISKWDMINDWENWVQSDMREQIYTDFDNTILSTHHTMLLKNSHIEPIFLL